MTDFTKKTDYVTEAKGLLISQFRDKQKMRDFLDAFVAQCQDLEEANWQTYSYRWVMDAEGEQLDLFGTIVGRLRGGLNDDDYRIALLAKIAENNSQGTIEDVVAVFNLITGTPKSVVVEVFPAEIGVMATTDISSLDAISILKTMQKVVSGGVKVYGVGQQTGDDSFAFKGVTEGKGFGDANDPLIGGKFATLLAAP
jgi:hypothetical protein